ncbi:helix-turn-helix domain-containing protein [Morganella psychrotolerans]|uniref:helix-turn-helix domain-containing protein n=1 Tax=Morganella psychrotolerans TaxID=368603 RepID=UPI0039B121E0
MNRLEKRLIVKREMEIILKLIGNELSRIRKSKKISGTELGEMIGISQQQMSRFERGYTRMDLGTMVCILYQLDISLFQFFFEIMEILKTNEPSMHEKYSPLVSRLTKMDISEKNNHTKNNIIN